MGEQDHLEELAHELKRARIGAGLGVAQLAKRAGVSTNTASSALNPKSGKPLPSLRTIAALAMACGVDVRPLLDLHDAARLQRQVADVEEAAAPSGPEWIMTADGAEPPERHFNPLRRENLFRSVQWALQSAAPVNLADPLPRFAGSGLYALYYAGPHELYTPISSELCGAPVFVGSALPGGRRSYRAEDGHVRGDESPVWRRLAEHHRKLEACTDLDPGDFRVRFLLTDELFIEPAADLTIRDHRPVWNVLLDGFGVHAPGSVRASRALRPRWHEVHQGIAWADQMQPQPDGAAVLRDAVRTHLASSVA
ncbi:Eco29kI family restriction endonuclease [Kitasatospora sp. NPDC004723]|uniref:Eco29kI family restriction endonuclease n=1 Tax=Kitasatospora sp. NPDC004723 TaxID=3154288 RepID=UPI0033A3EA5B